MTGLQWRGLTRVEPVRDTSRYSHLIYSQTQSVISSRSWYTQASFTLAHKGIMRPVCDPTFLMTRNIISSVYIIICCSLFLPMSAKGLEKILIRPALWTMTFNHYLSKPVLISSQIISTPEVQGWLGEKYDTDLLRLRRPLPHISHITPHMSHPLKCPSDPYGLTS